MEKIDRDDWNDFLDDDVLERETSQGDDDLTDLEEDESLYDDKEDATTISL